MAGSVLGMQGGIECLRRPVFYGRRSRSPVSAPRGAAAADSTRVQSQVRGGTTMAARNTCKGCLKQPLRTKRPVFVGCRSRSPAAQDMADAAASSAKVELPVRAFNTAVARNTGKGNNKGSHLYPHWPRNLAEALHRHQQFMQMHLDFVAEEDVQVPSEASDVYALLGEEDASLYEMIRRHLPLGFLGDQLALTMIERLAQTSHWMADRQNAIEIKRENVSHGAMCDSSGDEGAETSVIVYTCR
eukprot:s597_g1.t1